MYMAPLVENKEILEFNWFLCARPHKDSKDNYVIDISRYTTYFNTETGKSYHVTFDATEKGPCVLLLADNEHNIKKYQELSLGVDAQYKLSTSLGYCGLAMKTHREGGCRGPSDLMCDEAVFYFSRKAVEESKYCPYIEYAKTHSTHLRSVIPSFPSRDALQTYTPGKDSLKIRKLLLQEK